MSQDLIWEINNIFQIIEQPIDIIYKLIAIEKCKVKLGVKENKDFGEIYFNSLKNKKQSGTVYTPKEIAQYMIENTIEADDIIKNAFLKIVDPACGCGNIIIPCFLHLQKLFMENLEEINKSNRLNLTNEDINSHIIKNNIFGFDIDDIALKILCIDLIYAAHCLELENIKNEDFLFYEGNEKYDVFLGNPPYIGHKAIDKAYAVKAKAKYHQVYSDKGDISYCFYEAALNSLKYKGKITFISSRYFLESPSGKSLREALKNRCCINRIIDFYGVRPFKDTGIDPTILFLEQGKEEDIIEVIKPAVGQENDFLNLFYKSSIKGFKSFNLNKSSLDDTGWTLMDKKERLIIDKIKMKCTFRLEHLCESYQGIVTGCDKAFIVDGDTISEEGLECNIIKPWIKSSFINKSQVIRTDKHIIYSNLIEEEDIYKNCLRHIGAYKTKLMERRECKKGFRKWYELQWGRVRDIFESTKIVFPYKSPSNRFAIDKGSYFSADVYCLVLKEAAPVSLECLVSILNSKLYEFYFKSFAKKLGENLYEYYPNTVMKLYIPPIQEFQGDVDSFLYRYFELDKEEISIINSYVKS